MIKMKTAAAPGFSTLAVKGGTNEWELRPGGMLVQKRADSDRPAAPPPTIRVRVKYRSIYHEVSINSQAIFDRLEYMMKVIKRVNAAVMVVVEVEANLNSPTYVGRFIEALFFYGAFFYNLKECVWSELRVLTEVILYAGIRNLVAAVGRAGRLS